MDKVQILPKISECNELAISVCKKNLDDDYDPKSYCYNIIPRGGRICGKSSYRKHSGEGKCISRPQCILIRHHGPTAEVPLNKEDGEEFEKQLKLGFNKKEASEEELTEEESNIPEGISIDRKPDVTAEIFENEMNNIRNVIENEKDSSVPKTRSQSSVAKNTGKLLENERYIVNKKIDTDLEISVEENNNEKTSVTNENSVDEELLHRKAGSDLEIYVKEIDNTGDVEDMGYSDDDSEEKNRNFAIDNKMKEMDNEKKVKENEEEDGNKKLISRESVTDLERSERISNIEKVIGERKVSDDEGKLLHGQHSDQFKNEMQKQDKNRIVVPASKDIEEQMIENEEWISREKKFSKEIIEDEEIIYEVDENGRVIGRKKIPNRKFPRNEEPELKMVKNENTRVISGEKPVETHERRQLTRKREVVSGESIVDNEADASIFVDRKVIHKNKNMNDQVINDKKFDRNTTRIDKNISRKMKANKEVISHDNQKSKVGTNAQISYKTESIGSEVIHSRINKKKKEEYKEVIDSNIHGEASEDEVLDKSKEVMNKKNIMGKVLNNGQVEKNKTVMDKNEQISNEGLNGKKFEENTGEIEEPIYKEDMKSKQISEGHVEAIEQITNESVEENNEQLLEDQERKVVVQEIIKKKNIRPLGLSPLNKDEQSEKKIDVVIESKNKSSNTITDTEEIEQNSNLTNKLSNSSEFKITNQKERIKGRENFSVESDLEGIIDVKANIADETLIPSVVEDEPDFGELTAGPIPEELVQNSKRLSIETRMQTGEQLMEDLPTTDALNQSFIAKASPVRSQQFSTYVESGKTEDDEKGVFSFDGVRLEAQSQSGKDIMKYNDICNCLPGFCVCGSKHFVFAKDDIDNVWSTEEKIQKIHTESVAEWTKYTESIEDFSTTSSCFCYHSSEENDNGEMKVTSEASVHKAEVPSIEIIEKPKKKIFCSQPTFQKTVVIVKPEAINFKDAIFRAIKKAGLDIINERLIQLTPEQVSEVYGENLGSAYFPMFVRKMSSNPILVLVVAGNYAVDRWKYIIGQGKIIRSAWFYPESIKRRFEVNCDIFGAMSTSKDFDTAKNQLRYFFPLDIMDPIAIESAQIQDYCDKCIHPTLIKALTNVLHEKPRDPLLRLAEWLLRNNPFQPRYLDSLVAYAPT